MKKNYLFILALFIYQITLAQITVTKAANTPSIGTSFTGITFSALPGMTQAGANQTWDMSGAISTGSVTTDVIAKSSASMPSNYPQSTIATLTNGIENYYVIDNTTWAQEGNNLTPITNTKYTDVKELVDFPITYSTTYNETFSGTYTNLFTTYTRSGTISINGDAYGTLILPYATLHNVLRVRTVSNYTDVFGSSTDTYIDTTYSWYNATTHNVIASYNKIYKNGISQQDAGGYLDQTSIVLGVNDYKLDNLIYVYPNPASNELFLNFNEIPSLKGVSIQIIDLQARIVATDKLRENGQLYKMNITNLSKGIYTIKINYNNKIIVKKFIKK